MLSSSCARSFIRARSLHRCFPVQHFTSSIRHAFPRVLRAADGKPVPPIPSFSEQLARSQLPSFTEKIQRPSIRNQIFFFFAGSTVAFATAAAYTNLETDAWSKKLLTSSFWGSQMVSSSDIRRARYFALGAKLQSDLTNLKERISKWPYAFRNLIILGYVKVAQPYLDSSEARRMCWKICAFNTAVFLAWQIPRFRPIMNRSFMHHPLSGLSYTLLTSVFSHKSFLHLLFNCLALTSFGTTVSTYFHKKLRDSPNRLVEATDQWHFLAFFISAGIFSGLVSHIASARFKFPRFVSQLASPVTAASAKAVPTAAQPILPSLGASGAIYSAVIVTTLAYPEAHVSLVIPPSYPIPIQYGVGGLVMLDVIGILRGWRMFDHYAHLGGAAFGGLYFLFGPQWWESMRLRYKRPSEGGQNKSYQEPNGVL